jgi:hypothetical protein
MTPASIIMAAALAAWGAVAPAGEASPSGVTPAAAAVAPAPPVIPARALPIIANPRLDVRAAPAPLVAAPGRQSDSRRPLYRDWRFWAIAGGLFAVAVIVTIAQTRPGPQPYTGNTPPYFIGFP